MTTIYTNAPVAYDGFSTRTTDSCVGTDERGRSIRVVEIDACDTAWQTGRYQSGLYATFTPDLADQMFEDGLWKRRSMTAINAIIVYPDGEYRDVKADGLDDFQRLVGGDIERVDLGPIPGHRGHNAGYIDGFINDEGKLHGMERNPLSTYFAGLPGDYLAGPVVLVGPPDDDGNETGVPPWVAEWVRSLHPALESNDGFAIDAARGVMWVMPAFTASAFGWKELEPQSYPASAFRRINTYLWVLETDERQGLFHPGEIFETREHAIRAMISYLTLYTVMTQEQSEKHRYDLETLRSML